MSGGSDTERSTSPKPRNDKREKDKRVGKVRFEKKSNKELQPSSPKKEPKSYAFFSQEIAVTVENPQKRAREEKSNKVDQIAWETCRRIADNKDIAGWLLISSFSPHQLAELIEDERCICV